MRVLVPILIIALTACTTSRGQDTRFVEGTINRSEWASANWLRLDLATGRYTIRPGTYLGGYAEGQKRIERQAGTLDPSRLERLNAYVEEVMAAGFYDPECLAIPDSERTQIVISNGGRQELKISADGNSYFARDKLGCWTDQGNALYEFLEEEFEWSYGLRAFDERLKDP